MAAPTQPQQGTKRARPEIEPLAGPELDSLGDRYDMLKSEHDQLLVDHEVLQRSVDISEQLEQARQKMQDNYVHQIAIQDMVIQDQRKALERIEELLEEHAASRWVVSSLCDCEGLSVRLPGWQPMHVAMS